MSKKFSELPPKESLDSADYIPIVDSADSNPETQNKIVTFQTVRGYFTEDLDEFLEQAQTAESARVSAENTRRSNETTRQSNETTRQSNETTREANEDTRQANETARENAETGYIQQAKSWAVGTNGVAREGDATDNAKYYAEQASASATSASASATSASASATTAETAKDSAQASATQAAISAESVDAPALTKKILAAFPQESLSGSLLTLTDGADGIPVKTLTLNLSPHQSGSGDPSPENVRPISWYDSVKVVRTGKNVLPKSVARSQTTNGITFTAADDGTVMASGTATANAMFTIASGFTLPSGSYHLSGCPAGGGDGVYRIDAISSAASGFDYGRGASLTLAETTTFNYARTIIWSGQTVSGLVFHPMLRPAAFTDGTYAPYQGEDYTITIPTAAGTVYGGSLTVNDDGTGTLAVGWGSVDLGTLTWYKSDGDNPYFYATIAGKARGLTNVMSDRFATVSRSEWGSRDNVISGRDTTLQIYVRSSQYSSQTAAEFKASVSGISVVYEIATPQTYTLTASQVTTLLGNNTLWMDADGTIDLTYRADTHKYIDDRISALNANLAYIEDGTTASRAYAVGQYVLIGGQLYKVTSAIASGASFTIGTNVVATTVGTELTALN